MRLEAWLRALPKPVGLFADCDLLALDLIDACRTAGLDVPGDVAVLLPRRVACRLRFM